ncbi:MAG: ABC transporter substrate-binding protein [Holosporaceae bacterium]|nr:ABC transporter substrate-binding protein [Holosporaceae bacterium]
MNRKNMLAVAASILVVSAVAFFCFNANDDLPVVAIANYGPHASLEASLRGIRIELEAQGFSKNIRYEIADVGFDAALIPQMITKLRASNPKVMVVKSTPIAQFAKGKIHDVPLVYCDITDPVSAGLLKDATKSHENITGSSDQEDLESILNFAKILLPQAKTVGLLYSTSESNDAALVAMMKTAAANVGLSVVAVPVDQSRDIPVRMQEFRGKADFIYVGTSGPIQPALPSIASEAQKMGIPVFNVEDQAVRDGLALASFGVNYESVGRNAGKLVAKLLKGVSVKDLAPVYPKPEDYRCFVNKKLAQKFGIKIPKNATVLE